MQSFLGWIGGKRALRSKIIDRLPADAGRYIEVFGGAGWVLFGRDPSPGQLEVFNDYDSDLINIYRCVKYHPEELKKELAILPDSRELFFDFQTQEHMRGLTDISDLFGLLKCRFCFLRPRKIEALIFSFQMEFFFIPCEKRQPPSGWPET